MKRVSSTASLLSLVLSVFCAQTQAGQSYWMVDAGIQFKDDNTYDPDFLQALGLTYGYGLDAHWSVEIDYNRSFGGGSYSRDVSGVSGFTEMTETGEYTLWIAALGVSYRQLFTERFYLKAKLASSYSEEKRSSSTAGQADFNAEGGVAFGLGGGLLLGEMVGSSFTLEVDYTLYSNDYSGFSVGVNVTF